MYNWRRMSVRERKEILAWRRKNRRPWHSPPHEDRGEGVYHVTAACYEHKPIIGVSKERIAQCEERLMGVVKSHAQSICAWCVLPNHYHLLLRSEDIAELIAALGKFHGRQSYEWNSQDETRGRRVWYNCMERAIRSDRHFWATMNYVHHNPVHHGYVRQWHDWAFSSGADFLERVGKAAALRIWSEFPILDYGKGWDEPNM